MYIDLVASIGVKMDRSVVAVMKSKDEESYTLQKLSVVDCDSNDSAQNSCRTSDTFRPKIALVRPPCIWSYIRSK